MKSNGPLIVTKKVNGLNRFNGLNGRVPNYEVMDMDNLQKNEELMEYIQERSWRTYRRMKRSWNTYRRGHGEPTEE